MAEEKFYTIQGVRYFREASVILTGIRSDVREATRVQSTPKKLKVGI